MADEMLRQLQIPPVTAGLWEGLDSSAIDFPPNASPDLENIRLANQMWQPRLGFAAWKAIGGSGNTHYLARVNLKSGTNYTLAAQGDSLYQQTGGGAFALATNGNGIFTGGALTPRYGVYAGLTLKDNHYFLDRSGVLRKWNASGVTTVTQGTAPTIAPTTKRRAYAIYTSPAATNRAETWQGNNPSAPTGWTVDDATNFPVIIADATSDAVPAFPGGGAVAQFTIDSSGSKLDDVLVTSQLPFTLNSHDIAFFFQQSTKRYLTALELGQNKEAEFGIQVDPPEADQVYFLHFSLGNLPTIKYLRFRCKRVPGAPRTLYVSRLYLPGKLFGKYRYRFSFSNPTNGTETELSPATEFVDCSTVLTDYQTTDTAALEKSIELTVGTNTIPSVTTHPKVNWYRNGGLPELTKDGRGQDKYLRVRQSGNVNSSVATLTVVDALTLDIVTGEGGANLLAGDWVVIEPGVIDQEELVMVASVVINTPSGKDRITLDASTPIAKVHTLSTSNKVLSAHVDNTANESIDTTTNTLPERDDAPAGSHWIAKAPDGRMWLFRTDEKLEVAISNLPTADHPNDHEVFPDGVDPITRGSVLQGFRFYLDGDAHGDEITWGGFFNRTATVFTNRAMYQILASSQADWSPRSVVKVWETVGCLAGETVREVNGSLYWVADGPRVMRWDGRGAPEDLSFRKLTTTFSSAPSAYWEQWFAQARADKDGAYYDLYLTPSGGTTNTKVLSYNVVLGAWETHVYYASAAALPWAKTVVQDGPGDVREYYGAHPTSGNIRQLESGLTDNGDPITVRCKSRNFLFDGLLIKPEHWYGWYRATGADTLTVQLRLGASEYRNTGTFSGTDGDPASSWNKTLADTDTAEGELYKRSAFTILKGRELQLVLTGDLSNRPQVLRQEVRYSVVRRGRIGG